MPTQKEDIEYGQWVLCDHKIMYVYDMNEDDPDTVGLIEKNTRKYFDHYGFPFYEAKYYPAHEIQVLPEREIDEDTLLSFFRLETTPWELVEKECYPISEMRQIILTDDDLKAFSENIYHVDAMSLDAWVSQFIDYLPINHAKEEKIGLTMQLTLIILQQSLRLFDVEEDDRHTLTDIIDIYLTNKGKPIKEIDTTPSIKKQIIVGMEAQKETDVTEDEKRGYVRFLEDLYETGEIDSLRHTAYAYYTGTNLVKQNWEKAKEALLKLFDLGKQDVAYTLAAIFYREGAIEYSNYEKAFQYYTIASKQGIAEAQNKICDMYRRGLGVEKNTTKAFDTLKQLYDNQMRIFGQGQYDCIYPEVSRHMGLYYENGVGCRKNLEEALRYYEMAKSALSQRRIHDPETNDQTLENNIDHSIERIHDKMNTDDYEALKRQYKIS